MRDQRDYILVPIEYLAEENTPISAISSEQVCYTKSYYKIEKGVGASLTFFFSSKGSVVSISST